MKKKYLIMVEAILALFLISCNNNNDNNNDNDNELKEVVRLLNEKSIVSSNDLIGFDKAEYDGHTVTMVYSFAEGAVDYEGVRANKESFRNNMLIGYANNSEKAMKKMLDAIVKAEANLCLVLNFENHEPIELCYTTEELKNNLPKAEADPLVLLKTMADNARLQTPVEVDEGLVMTDVLLDEHYYIYVYECDESEYDMDYMEEVKSETKEIMLENILDDSDSMVRAMCSLLKEVHYGLAFKYVGASSGKTCIIYIEPDEL